MTGALATVEDLAEFLGEAIEPASADSKRATWCLRGASVLVRDEADDPDLGDPERDDPVPEAALLAVLACAGRGYTNPTAQTSAGIDDAQERWRVEEAGLYLTETEKRSLHSLRPASTGISTLSTTRDGRPRRNNRVPTGTEGVEIPWW